MKLLALDVSTKSTGWFMSKRTLGLIAPPENLTFEHKLCYFRDELIKILEKYKPTVVVIEDTYLRFQNPQTLKQLSRFSGVALEACARSGAEVHLLTATQARKNCCGKQTGDFKKKEVFKFFVEKYGFSDWTFDSHNDLTDAMALYWGFREKEKRSEKKNDNPKK